MVAGPISLKNNNTLEPSMNTILRSTVALSLLLLFTTYHQPAVASDQKAVLVTGASTGIGREIAETLARDGYFVYAGARKQKDLDALNAIDNIQAVRLDVTVQEEIDAAVKTVREGGKGLHGLINNAGIYVGGPLIEVDVDEIQWLMDVNVYGVVRVTQAFAPMIIESKGRISTIGSISGILSGRFSGPYSMSKHAIEAYTDSLATEMAKFDVHVSVIEPGNYDSAIADTALARMSDDDYFDEDSYYAEEMKEWFSRPWDRSQYKGPEEVAEAAVDAMFGDSPARRYMVVPSEEEAGWTIDKAIEELVQLNEWQAYSYTREQLIEKLDAALAPPAQAEEDSE
jgi:NAD(P)-dependent dehydrogenase (short-subunit alcohol dehydrogenase family)